MQPTHGSRLSEAMFSTAHRTFSRWQKLLLLTSAIVACLIAFTSFKTIDGAIRGYSASLLHHGSASLGVASAVIASAAAAVVGLLIAGRVRPDAGLFAAAVALLVFRLQGGGAGMTLLVAGGRPGFAVMLIEIAVLAAVLLAVYAVQRLMVAQTTIADDAARDGCTVEQESLDQKLLCSATVAVVMTAGMMIVAQSDEPFQAAWAVFLSAFASTWCAFRFIPLAPSFWYWIGTIIAGLAGYAYCYFSGYQNAAIGEPTGMLASLARATPLDYSSVGVIGSLTGYWVGRKQHRDREEQADAEAAEGTNFATG